MASRQAAGLANQLLERTPRPALRDTWAWGALRDSPARMRRRRRRRKASRRPLAGYDLALPCAIPVKALGLPVVVVMMTMVLLAWLCPRYLGTCSTTTKRLGCWA